MKNIIEKWFEIKIDLEKIDQYCSRIEVKKKNIVENVNEENVCVSCVQRMIKPVMHVESYIDIISSFLRYAVKEGSNLVIFPEYNYFDLFGLIPGFININQLLNTIAMGKAGKMKKKSSSKGTRTNRFLINIFKNTARPIEAGMNRITSLLAIKYGLYIYSGSYLLMEDGEMYNAGSLFGPDGQLIGTQKKLHLTDFEVNLGIKNGTKMEIFSLPFGKVVFPVCMDATYFETFRIARELGADIVILPIANMEEFNHWKARRGIWPRVQESYVYGLKSSLNGWIAGLHFTGQAGIFAPLSLTQNKDGILSITSSSEGDFTVTESINMIKLREEREKAEYHGDKNPFFERDYTNQTYIG